MVRYFRFRISDFRFGRKKTAGPKPASALYLLPLFLKSHAYSLKPLQHSRSNANCKATKKTTPSLVRTLVVTAFMRSSLFTFALSLLPCSGGLYFYLLPFSLSLLQPRSGCTPKPRVAERTLGPKSQCSRQPRRG